MEKKFEYAAKILAQLSEIVNNEECPNYIDSEELSDSENATQFIHALATIAPTTFYNKLTGSHKNHLEFNHIANHLCFQFSDKKI